MKRYRWNLLPEIPESAVGEYNPLITQLLVNRRITSPELQKIWLSADDRLLENPFLMPDTSKALARLTSALRNKEKIGIYGDFDADGICGTVLLAEGLQALGGIIVPYLPHRIEDGYGLNSKALDYLKQVGVSLVVSVDCGITSFSEALYAKNLGMDLIITDHHRSISNIADETVENGNAKLPAGDSKYCLAETLPYALAVLDPWRSDSLYPFPHLSGTGVAFKLMQALYRVMGQDIPQDKVLELVALATVADMQPLTGENRYLVKRGLEELNRSSRPGLRELIKASGLAFGKIRSEDISWVIGPRLNAAGRIDHALLGYNLFFSRDARDAEEKALGLVKLNQERQKITQDAYEKAREQVMPDSPLIIAQGNFPQGVIGIIAGKLSREFYRPAIVIQEGEGQYRGSARSIPEFDLVEALTKLKNLLERYGGHARAAGFTISQDKVDLFRNEILKLAEIDLTCVELFPTLNIDAQITLSQITDKVLMGLEQLEPFGQENPKPAFLTRGVSLVENNRMGKRKEHLKVKIKDGDKFFNAVGFNLGNNLEQLDKDSKLDVVFSIVKDNWKGIETLRLELLDVEKAQEQY